MSIVQLFRDTIATHGDAVAFETGTSKRTYAELGERSDRVAAGLLALGVNPGDRVALLDRNSPEYWEVLLGTLKVGGIFVPFNHRLLAAEISWLIEDSDPTVLFVGADHREVLPDALDIEVVGLDPDAYEAWLADHDPHDPHLAVDPSDTIQIIYSSGTTGRPKGVLVGDGQLEWALGTFGSFFDLDEHSRNLVPAPYFHVAGAGWTMITLFRGGTVLDLRDPTPELVVGGLTVGGATHAVLVPAVLGMLVAVDALKPEQFGPLRQIVYGASPITPAVMRASIELFGAEMIQSYGLSETLGTTSVLTAEDHDLATGAPKLASAGRHVPGVEIEIRSVENPEEQLEAGHSGEIVVRGPSVTAGYWRNDGATAGAFTADGFFRTGDIGLLDDDGFLFIQDRLKDMIVSGGENIYPAEVEAVLADHPGVADIAVIGVASERWGESPIAVIVPAGDPPDEDAFISWARERLAHYKCPTRVEFSESLPRNASGKLLKRELREQYR